MIRAKMRVWSNEDLGYCDQVTLSAVCDGSEENKSFSTATPSATLNISISNPAARGVFKPGQEYYLDFTLASEPQPQVPPPNP